jgi:Transglycosylase-like domain
MACALAVPGVAYANYLPHQANHLRHEVVAKFGKRAAGRDIVRWGVLKRDGTARRATRTELTHYRDVLARIVAPPAPEPTGASSPASTESGSTSSTVQTQSAPSTSGGSGSGNLPACTWTPESGGDWNAVNPSSGAGGHYQIMPSTWTANGGTGLPQNASPAEQTRVAENVMRSQGASAWTNC